MKTIILALLFVCGGARATCPITECNYLDPHYKTALDAWENCVRAFTDKFTHAMDQQAVLYSRFGIAWDAQQAEMEADTKPNDSHIAEIHRRFEDRILRTAEPDALEFYNLMILKVKQGVGERCGATPEPPKGQP